VRSLLLLLLLFSAQRVSRAADSAQDVCTLWSWYRCVAAKMQAHCGEPKWSRDLRAFYDCSLPPHAL